MITACHDSIEARMSANRTVRGDVLWNTADVAPNSIRGYYDVTGTGTVDGAFQIPFAFTCMVEFGPPTLAVDNGFTLNP